ncbi:MAG TPA: phosphodiesterase [Mycobacterium sp.]|nr:phosphodiesterase [Mycobacterium sp.]
MLFSDIAALPIRAGAALRHRRLFHPVGVLAEGTLDRTAPPGEGLPLKSGDVVGRVSKGVGLPGDFPDIAGLAWRMSPQWDVLLASTTGARLALAPVTKWTGASFSSLMPLQFEGGVWWLRARLVTPIGAKGLALDTVREHIRSTGVDFDIEQAAGTGDFLPLARLTLRTLLPDRNEIAFDPTVHSDPAVRLLPGWLTNFRRAAYRRSRQGRDAE